MRTGAHDEAVGRNAEEQTGRGNLAISLPEPEVEVVLVRTLVGQRGGFASLDEEVRVMDAARTTDRTRRTLRPTRGGHAEQAV
jgi:hypothetical protein